jgi:hypothetical protein
MVEIITTGGHFQTAKATPGLRRYLAGGYQKHGDSTTLDHPVIRY